MPFEGLDIRNGPVLLRSAWPVRTDGEQPLKIVVGVGRLD